MTSFHFLRPEWLIAIVPVLLAGLFKVQQQRKLGQWQSVIAPQLRQYVVGEQSGSSSKKWFTLSLLMAALFAILALAGPTWEKQASPVYSSRSGLVIGLDLSISMTAKDVTPSRVQRAKYKIIDILKSPKVREQYSQVGLIAYAEDAHVVSPLTEDGNTIEALLPALDPFMMPAMGGSNFARLAEAAANMFEQNHSEPRRLLVITDGVEPMDIEPAAEQLKQHDIQLAIIAIGTESGAPMVKPDGRFITDQQGRTIMPGLEWNDLELLSRDTGADLTRFSNSDRDFLSVIDHNGFLEAEKTNETAEFDQWKDMGHWLVIPCLLFFLTAFRRGYILCLLGFTLTIPNESWAAPEWLPSWLLNQDQQGYREFQHNPESAAETFQDNNWKGTSHYKNGQYEKALQSWSNADDAQSWYNRGNALAKLNRFDEAIKAYEQALEKNPALEDAKYNKALVERLKKQQQQQQNQQGDQSQQNKQNEQGQQDQQAQQNQQGQQGEQNQQAQQNQQASEGQQSDSSSESQNDPLQSGDESRNPAQQDESQRLAQQEDQADSDEQDDDQQQMVAQQEKQKPEAAQQGGFIQQPDTDAEHSEKSQALQQWMSRIPDDPSGLLRNKFYYQYQQRNRSPREGDRKSW